MNRPNSLAEVADRLSADRAALHVAMAGFLDSFYMRLERRQAMIDPEPRLLGDPILDAIDRRRWRVSGTPVEVDDSALD